MKGVKTCLFLKSVRANHENMEYNSFFLVSDHVADIEPLFSENKSLQLMFKFFVSSLMSSILT
jgi:hypothetical protein